MRAIVLRVDSPGGSGTASDVIWREVRLAPPAKPVVVSMGDVAASGGYYIAMGGDAIVAEPGTITGSIGVFSGKFSLRGLYDKLGLTEEIVTRGRNATLFTTTSPGPTRSARRCASMNVAFYADFIPRRPRGARRRRRRSTPWPRDASGRARRRSRWGLVDRLGGLDVALRLAREKARIARTRS